MVVSFELDGRPFTALNGGPSSGSARPCRSRSSAPTRMLDMGKIEIAGLEAAAA
jgi:hypothetical protein